MKEKLEDEKGWEEKKSGSLRVNGFMCLDLIPAGFSCLQTL